MFHSRVFVNHLQAAVWLDSISNRVMVNRQEIANVEAPTTTPGLKDRG